VGQRINGKRGLGVRNGEKCSRGPGQTSFSLGALEKVSGSRGTQNAMKKGAAWGGTAKNSVLRHQLKGEHLGGK